MKLWFKAILLMVLISVGFFVHRLGWVSDLLDREHLVLFLFQNSTIAYSALIIGGAFYTALGGPRQMLALAFGYILGGFYGALLSTLITLAGCVLTVLFVRFLISDVVRQIYPRQVDFLHSLLDANAWLSIMAIRLFPVGSNLLTNVFAGAAKIRLLPMIVGSFWGYLPQMLVFSYAGAGIGWSDQKRILISFLLLLISTAIATWLCRGTIRKQFSLIQAKPEETKSV